MFFTRFKKLLFLLYNPKALIIFLKYRVVPSIEHRPVLSSKLDLVVDVGANRGQFALAARLFSKARVVSFEPLFNTFAICNSVFAHDECVEVHQVAIGPQKGRVILHISNRDDSSSLLGIGENQVDVFPGTEEIGVEEVQSAPLDEFISFDGFCGRSLLKIDVQGYELEVLRSAHDLLPCFTYIYCECSFVELYEGQPLCYEIIAYLSKMGFVLSGIYNVIYNAAGSAVQADMYFLRNQ